jgi:hypothetical protein
LEPLRDPEREPDEDEPELEPERFLPPVDPLSSPNIDFSFVMTPPFLPALLRELLPPRDEEERRDDDDDDDEERFFFVAMIASVEGCQR